MHQTYTQQVAVNRTSIST